MGMETSGWNEATDELRTFMVTLHAIYTMDEESTSSSEQELY